MSLFIHVVVLSSLATGNITAEDLQSKQQPALTPFFEMGKPQSLHGKDAYGFFY
jgi:hypothetical protein